jgi:hypothetical protein
VPLRTIRKALVTYTPKKDAIEKMAASAAWEEENKERREKASYA